MLITKNSNNDVSKDSPDLLCLKMAKFRFNYSNIANLTLSKFQVESKSDAAGLQFS